MALFGFNKQKVLATAEKYVQQGKLQNAISEYEKVLKNDPKDLTVTNTVGDLYSRLGEVDKATDCFKNVGDAYASQGFTVKAIAMYKKIGKLKPSLESLLKLAELYTQQGLFNDARAQYLQVAEEFLKAGELENAVRIFQKILEMDPENSNMRIRLAEVYVRLGKKTEAWEIFTAAAESLRSKGSLNAAEEVLQRMLTLDPGNTYALVMQGKNLLESGDAAGAVTALQKIADIDSNPEALRDLLKAYLQTGQLSEAGTVANKLLTVHNDLPAISMFADALMQAGQYETALQVFDQHAERLLAENSDKVLESLHTVIGHVRDNPDSLQKLLDLFNKAGESTHVGEVIELLAHASVQAGDLPRARDLYQRLAQIEPQNPLHMQNYQQVVSQLGGTSGSKLITPEEAVVLIDDLEATAPSIHQHYSDEVSLSVRSALTDAELFISYNMPQKALGPLMTALPLAPHDLRINQRLAALHTRASRFAEAGMCCRTLQTLYSDAGYPEEATRYGELADRYEERSSTHELAAVAHEASPAGTVSEVHRQTESEAYEQAEAAPEFSIDEAEEISVDDESPAAEEAQVTSSPWPTVAANAHQPKIEAEELPVVAETPQHSTDAAAGTEEIDLSSEWDDAITVETDELAVAQSEGDTPAEAAVASHEAEEPAEIEVHDPAKVDETVEEIRFYLANGMPEQSMAALAKLQVLTNDQAKIDELRAEVELALQQAEESPAASEPVVEELSADDIPSAETSVEEEESPAAIEESAAEPEPVAVEAEAAAIEPEPAVAETEITPEPVIAEPEPAPEPAHAAASEFKPGGLKEFVSDLESSLGDTFLPAPVAKPVEMEPQFVPPAAPAHQPAAFDASTAMAAAPNVPVLGKVVAEIEASLGEDFLKAAPVAASHAAQVTPLAASAAASASANSQVAPPALHIPVNAASASAAPSPVAMAAHASAPAAAAPIVPPAIQAAGIDLAEMFGELKQDLESGATVSQEDPETHYNLGIAFREMGLLDEAIGELQKACQAFDRGHPFPQILQTYTWLAHCFLETGVPEAAVRWYEKALHVSGIDGETRTALHYELAGAHEAAGDKAAALKYFLEVYGNNIDYRDVSERIKALKS
jgi:tetratricopeptide (TPR) repeat protein